MQCYHTRQLSSNQKQIKLTFLLGWINLQWEIFLKQKLILMYFKLNLEKEELNRM